MSLPSRALPAGFIAPCLPEPAPGVVAVTEYELVRTATSISPSGEPEHGEGIAPAGTST